jgi:hypothetical protein
MSADEWVPFAALGISAATTLVSAFLTRRSTQAARNALHAVDDADQAEKLLTALLALAREVSASESDDHDGKPPLLPDPRRTQRRESR